MIVPENKEFSFQTRALHLQQMAQGELDLLIIGGGINGVWMALDARLRGLQVGLIEAADFGHGPSRNNSELLHGGFRYLKEWYQNPKNWFKIRGVLHLVRHALREREVMMKIAPHLARPIPFCMPLYAPKGLGFAKRSFYSLGFWMYDKLSGAQTIEPYSMYSAEDTLKKLRGIRKERLVGCGVYYDCKMEPGRFIAEIASAASYQGALLANYAKAHKPIWNKDKKDILGFCCVDQYTNKSYEIRAQTIIDATGPWGDVFRQKIWKMDAPLLRLSKGVHIMVPQMFDKPIACAFFTDDKRIIFIVPWGEGYNYSLIGTTDTDYSKHPDEIAPDEQSMNYLIEKVRNQFPEANLTCFGNYAGIRPLVRQEEGKPSSVSREHTIRRQGKTRLTSVFGGKWTTARLVACETLDILFPQTKGQSQTHLLRFGGKDVQDLMENGFPRADEQLQSLGKELNLYPEVLDHLIFNYGRNAKDVLAIAKENSDWLKPILPDRPFIRAEVIYAVRYEMAIRVADYLIRRSIFGRLRERGLKAAPVVAALMAKEMAWDENRQKEEVDFYEQSTRILK